MIKRTTKETVNEYDADGKIVRTTVTETTEEDDETRYPVIPTSTTPYYDWFTHTGTPIWRDYINTTATGNQGVCQECGEK